MSIRDSMSQKEMNRWNNMTEQQKRDVFDPAGRLFRENNRLKTEVSNLLEVIEQAHSALDDALGDTDPDLTGYTEEEVRLYEPTFWAERLLAGAFPPEVRRGGDG